MGLFDFLGQLGNVVAPAARGYLGGQVQGIQYQNQQRERDLQNQLRQQQLELQRMKLLQDAEQAQANTRDRSREALQKHALDWNLWKNQHPNEYAELQRHRNPDGSNAAQMMDRDAAEAYRYATDPALNPSDFKFSLPQLAQALAENPPEPPDNRPSLIGFNPLDLAAAKNPILAPGLGLKQAMNPDYLAQSAVPGQEAVSPPSFDVAPQLKKALDSNLIPIKGLPARAEPTTTITAPSQTLYPFSEAYTADVNLKKSQAAKTEAETELTGLRAAAEALHIPNIRGLDAATIRQKIASAVLAETQAEAVPKKVEIQRTQVQNQYTLGKERNKIQRDLGEERNQINQERNAINADLTRMKTITEGNKAMEIELRVRRLADQLPKDVADRARALAAKLYGFDSLNGEWVRNDQAAQELDQLIKGSMQTYSQGSGLPNSGGSENRAFVRTEDKTVNTGTGPKVNTVRRGNFKAAFGTSQGGKAQTSAAPDNKLVNDPELRATVSAKKKEGPKAYQEFLNRLAPGDRKTVESIANVVGMQSKKAAIKAKASTPRTSPKSQPKAVPNLIAIPKRKKNG